MRRILTLSGVILGTATRCSLCQGTASSWSVLRHAAEHVPVARGSFASCPNLALPGQGIPFQIAQMSSSSAAGEQPPADQKPLATEPEASEPVAEAASDAAAATAVPDAPPAEPELPPLSPSEFRTYNRMSEGMNYFHDHFRKTWNMLYTACDSGRRPGGMSLRQFIDEGLGLTRYLEMHHGIEEAHIFPLLARKMPEFRSGGRNDEGAAELLRQHRDIHAGMDVFAEYLRKCKSGETELSLTVMKEKMDTWGPVLLTHLDQEVKTLGAENMRKYWTLAEMRAMPM